MHAFRIYLPLVAAGLVLLLINVVTVFPFWPGNVGLVQAAIAVSLSQYGVPYGRGFAFGIGLQAIEASVGIGIGTLFLAREGLTYASLKSMETSEPDEVDQPAVGDASSDDPSLGDAAPESGSASANETRARLTG